MSPHPKLLFLLLLFACDDAVVGSDPIQRCDTDEECPSGSRCLEGLCLGFDLEPLPLDLSLDAALRDRAEGDHILEDMSRDREAPADFGQDQENRELQTLDILLSDVTQPDSALDAQGDLGLDSGGDLGLDSGGDLGLDLLPVDVSAVDLALDQGNIDLSFGDQPELDAEPLDASDLSSADVEFCLPEICDGRDNDCDGEIDEDLSRSCGESIGICFPGIRRCIFGLWAECEGMIPPREELCNGLDDDCDGEIDEEFPDFGEICLRGSGACLNQGQMECSPDQSKTICSVTPGQASGEICNQIDDDCDAQIDESSEDEPLEESCYSGPEETENIGRCLPGVRSCVEGEWIECEGEQLPEEESCNGLDDDCDELIDEAEGGGPLLQGCYEGPEGSESLGLCQAGEQSCQFGVYAACIGQVLPALEICDGEDNDCDGEIDNGLDCSCLPGLPQICYSGPEESLGQGLCQAGLQLCLPDGLDFRFGDCLEQILPSVEVCDGEDNDCNGIVDDNIAAVGAECIQGVGACLQYGNIICSSGEFLCDVPEVSAQEEICDEIDNDCDGQTDEDFELGEPCLVGVGACTSEGIWACGLEGDVVCDAEIPTGQQEICDTIDNDCDGEVDEGITPISCGINVGECAFGVRYCLNGEFGPCEEQQLPQEEICDGLDNDCDGAVDEDLLGQECGSNIGTCQTGLRFCQDGALSPICIAEVEAIDEICDGLDNDCDGENDEGDRDLDGLDDCLELRVGLDPDDPEDALADYDHDDLSNAEEAIAGSPLWPVLYLVSGESEGDEISVRLMFRQDNTDALPFIIETQLYHTLGRVELQSVLAGPATLEAEKMISIQPLSESSFRIVIISSNPNLIQNGELGRFFFHRISRRAINFRLNPQATFMQPGEAQESASFGVGYPSEPLRFP